MEIVVYGRSVPVCPYCVKTKEVLDNNNIKYTYKDITDNMDEFLQLGVRTVPQVVVDGVNFGGFDNIRSTLKHIQSGVKKDMIRVTKRDGSLSELTLEKIHKVLSWAAEGLKNVSISEVELKAHIQFYDKMTTSDIQKMLIKSAADLISVDTPDYQFLAARLCAFNIRKEAYGSFTPPDLFTHTKRLVDTGKYDKHLIEDYTEEEFNIIDKFIKHSRDMDFAYAGIKQLEGKYLVQNRVTGEIYESPQFLYVLVGMCLYAKYEGEKRMEAVKKFYNACSTFKLSLPTPIMAGVRTPTRQFSSCVLIDCGDSLDSINASSASIVKYISRKAGIGLNGGRIRALGSEIRNGEGKHTGVIPFYKHFQTAVKSCSQGGVRGGAATLFYPIWHLEVENLLVLKNNKGVDENRVRHLDYGVQFNKLMYQRFVKDDYITLFSPSDVEGLYDAFFQDQDKFEKLYIKYEQDKSIRKKRVKAVELFSTFAMERASTGRIYLQNVDHTNLYSPFDEKVAPIYQSNLCLEIALPTKPLNDVNDPNGEVALCTLSAFNLGAIKDLSELEELAKIAVSALDELLDYQDYPLPAAYNSSMNRRTLGVGVINFAHDLARKGYKYSDGSANNYVHELFEAIQFYLMKASNELAKEKGACPKFNETVYAKGVMPVDLYKKEVDNLHTAELKLDWDGLRKDIVKYGMRNSTVSALMPAETSAQVSNSTNGIEPPRGLVSVKASKDGILKQVVPKIKSLKNSYELLWDIPDNKGYLALVAIMQKFIDQTISANTNYDPSKFGGNKVPLKVIIDDMLFAYKHGVKTFYYHNTRDGAGESSEEVVEKEDDSCAGGACKI